MDITVRNNSSLPNKFVRFIKWKLYQASDRFDALHYARVFLKQEGNSSPDYILQIKLGVPGKDIILADQDKDPGVLMNRFSKSLYRYLRKKKEKEIKKGI
ncbi:MAG: hypothetical protein R2879_04925 [Saprospiraceae bacterium]